MAYSLQVKSQRTNIFRLKLNSIFEKKAKQQQNSTIFNYKFEYQIKKCKLLKLGLNETIDQYSVCAVIYLIH